MLILVKSQRAGQRVMKSITRYLERSLKLAVNLVKSKVAPVTGMYSAPQQGRAEIRDLAARRAARGSQPEGTSAGISAGSRLGGVALSIQAMTAPCR